MDIPVAVGGDDDFALGMNGYTLPAKLHPGEYESAMNTICRGGMVQTRPGSVSVFDMPEGNLQGVTMFAPMSGVPTLVFAVDGLIYVSPYPFSGYSQLTNLQFSPFSKFIAWAACIKSTDYDPAGQIYSLATPYPILIMQDGATRAAYWDGSSSGHLNPTKSAGTITLAGFDETPIGLWMKWSNNRLWVSRKSQVFASDIGNPTKFKDTQYLNQGRAFQISGDCTGAEDTADRQGVLFFTDEDATFFRSSIQDRNTWTSTPEFQKTVFHDIGCVAPRSIVHQYGLLWWMTAKGVINQDDALALNVTSRLQIQDNEMIQSKSNLSYNLLGTCGSFMENFLFHAVPNGDKLNTRLHVLDQAPFDQAQNAWPSYWTGWRPVEFAKGIISSQERVFCASYDYDGVNRMWELFRPEKTDNGMPITSFVAGRQQFGDNRDYKDFRYIEVELQNISGPTAVMGAVAGLRGAFQTVLTKDINSINGQVYADAEYGLNAHQFVGTKPQTRIVRTQDDRIASDCNSLCIESDIKGMTDKCFSVLIAWSGIAGISAYRIFWQNNPTAYQGTCEDNETGEDRLITPAGCGAESQFSTKEAFTTYYSTQTYELDGATHTSTQSSVISQVDADRKALAMATWYVLQALGQVS